MKYTLLVLAFLIDSQLYSLAQSTVESNVKPFNAAIQAKEDSIIEQNLMMAAKFLSGIDAVKDEKKAFDIYWNCALKGSVKAMNALGILYKEGLGVNANRTSAIQWFQKAGANGYAKGYYNLGMLYKDGKTDNERDYDKAFTNFAKAAKLNDPQSIYATGYFYYKGFGTTQNYRRAFQLFRSGSYEGRSNSMYFLGLCYRNGYGTEMNIDSARFWLNRAYSKGYRVAGEELASAKSENSNIGAQELERKIKQLTPSIPENLNQFKALQNIMPSTDICGLYKGFIIRYDWSGEYAIGASRLFIELKKEHGELIGKWIEADTMTVPFQAVMTPHSFVFNNTSYVRKDHYYERNGKSFRFETAKLQWMQKGDSIYLTGSVQMFSDELNEPQKPLFISLVKTTNINSILGIESFYDNNKQITLTEEDGSPLFSKNQVSAFPNPFRSYINVDLKLKSSEIVEVQLLTSDGRIVYKNNGGRLKAGDYSITIRPPNLSAGNYFLKVFIGNLCKTIKVIKL